MRIRKALVRKKSRNTVCEPGFVEVHITRKASLVSSEEVISIVDNEAPLRAAVIINYFHVGECRRRDYCANVALGCD